MPRSCAQQGHCYHNPDGSQYVGDNLGGSPTDGTVTVTCCWCPQTAVKPTYSAALMAYVADSFVPVKVAHGVKP